MKDKCGWGEEISSSEEKRKREKKERKEREKGDKERERIKGRRGRRPVVFFSDLRCSDSQKSLDQGVKSVYVMRASLQEVGILPTFFYFPP